MTLKVGPRGLRETLGLKRRVRRHRVKTVRLTVVAKDASGTSTTLTALLRRFR